MNRTVLVILSNRFNRSERVRYLEVRCKPDGAILAERPLRAQPREPRYDEVWQNDEGKACLDDCTRIKRHYRHPLEKPRPLATAARRKPAARRSRSAS